MTDTAGTVSAVGLTMDCLDPVRTADFWQAAIGFAKRVGNGDPYITLSESAVGRPLNHLTIQRVPEEKVVKNRAHLDLFARDHASEVARLQSLGARVLEAPDAARPGHLGFLATVMADPEGHEFCVVSRPPTG
jgi:predicted enzyme related to lactoylglutathione lyase